jgi:hypothetical protein
VTSNRLAFVEGFAWHAFPTRMTERPAEPNIKNWIDANADEPFILCTYGPDGVLVLTVKDAPPPLPEGWSFQAVSMDDGWTYHQYNWRWKMVSRKDSGLYIFAGVVV